MKILEHRENLFPDDLEGRMNAILNVVNTELKAVTLLHLDDVPVDGIIAGAKDACFYRRILIYFYQFLKDCDTFVYRRQFVFLSFIGARKSLP